MPEIHVDGSIALQQTRFNLDTSQAKAEVFSLGGGRELGELVKEDKYAQVYSVVAPTSTRSLEAHLLDLRGASRKQRRLKEKFVIEKLRKSELFLEQLEAAGLVCILRYAEGNYGLNAEIQQPEKTSIGRESPLNAPSYTLPKEYNPIGAAFGMLIRYCVEAHKPLPNMDFISLSTDGEVERLRWPYEYTHNQVAVSDWAILQLTIYLKCESTTVLRSSVLQKPLGGFTSEFLEIQTSGSSTEVQRHGKRRTGRATPERRDLEFVLRFAAMIANDSSQDNTTLGVGQSFYAHHLCTDISSKRYPGFPMNEVIRKLRAWSDRLAGAIRRLPALLKRWRDKRSEIWDVSLPAVFSILQQRKQDLSAMVNRMHWAENFEWVVESGVRSFGKWDHPDDIWVRISNVTVGYYMYQGKSSPNGPPYLPMGDGQPYDAIFMDMARSHGLCRVLSNMAPLMKAMKKIADDELGCLDTMLRHKNNKEYEDRNRLRGDDLWALYRPGIHLVNIFSLTELEDLGLLSDDLEFCHGNMDPYIT